MPQKEVVQAEAKAIDAARRNVEKQGKFALITFWIGTAIMLVTLVMPVIGKLAPLFGWGCKTVTIEAVPTLVCAKVESPWSLMLGVGLGLGLYLASAAFSQVSVGGVGAKWLEKLPGLGGGKK